MGPLHQAHSGCYPLPENAIAGDWWIRLAVFGDATQPEGRLRVLLADGTADAQIGLGPIRVDH